MVFYGLNCTMKWWNLKARFWQLYPISILRK